MGIVRDNHLTLKQIKYENTSTNFIFKAAGTISFEFEWSTSPLRTRQSFATSQSAIPPYRRMGERANKGIQKVQPNPTQLSQASNTPGL